MSSSNIPITSSFYIVYEFFISGIIWIPYTILLFVLFYEHHIKNRYPQNIIILLLSIGSLIRCIWYFLYWQYGSCLLELILNRTAILLQFSSISILLLMWSRAVKVLPTAMKHMSFNNNPTNYNFNDEFRIKLYQNVTIIVNFLAWVFILCTLANEDNAWYAINILLLSVMCLLESVMIITIGISTGLKLYIEMSPVYASAGNRPISIPNYNNNNSCCSSFLLPFTLFHFIYKSNSNMRSLQIQKEVLKLLLSTSIIVSLCFLIRSIVFYLSRDILRYSIIADYITYPFFFYQIPESIPTLVIARGIAPPNSIIRRINICKLCSLRCVRKKTIESNDKNIAESRPSIVNPMSWSLQLSYYSSEDNMSSSISASGNSDITTNTDITRYCGSIIDSSQLRFDSNRQTDDIDELKEISKQEIDEFLYRTQSFG